MRCVVVGGSGLVGARLVAQLRAAGDDVVSASRSTGVDTVTGEGLSDALHGADVVVDVSNAPAFEDGAVLAFFEASGRNLLRAAADAGVGHHIALSVVGTDRLQASGYFRAKRAQERLIEGSGIPHTFGRATQFFEFARGIADAAAAGGTVRLPVALVQPIAADDVARGLAEVARGRPEGTIELAGPETLPLDDFVRRFLHASDDGRTVIGDPGTAYFGAMLEARTLLPDDGARIGPTRFADWLRRANLHTSRS